MTKNEIITDYCNLSSENDDNEKKDLIRRLENIERQYAQESFIIEGRKQDCEENKNEFHLIRWINGNCYTWQYVGFLADEDGNITINTRFDKKSDKQYFLLYLFGKVYNINSRVFQNMKPTVDQMATWDILLIVMFINQLNIAAKKGHYRQYCTYKKNDSKVKGTLDLSRHIKENLLLKNGKMAYTYREYTIDNPVNKLIYAAYYFAEKKYPNIVKKLCKEYENSAGAIRLFEQNFEIPTRRQALYLCDKCKRKINHPIYMEWEKVRKISILLLRRIGIQSKNSQMNAYGFLIDMNVLWEEYIRTVCGIIKPGNESILEGRKNIRLDLYYDKEGEELQRLVLDAKNKPKWEEIYKKEIKRNKEGEWKWPEDVREDVFQVLAYMLIKDSSLGGVVFPCKEEEGTGKGEKRKFKVNNNIDKRFYLLPMIISNKDDKWSKFENEMKNNEDILREEIRKIRA